MLTTTFFAFLSGILTVASPCVLPVLPFLLSGSIGGKSRPYGIIAGFIASFTVFTLFLSAIVQALGVSPDALRLVSVGLLLMFGLVLCVPQLHTSFAELGLPVWFGYCIGASEVAGAICLFIRPLSALAAAFTRVSVSRSRYRVT